MKYRKDRYGNDISILGYGCMRLSGAPKIDIDKAEKEMMSAITAGVNYFDTAYIYPGSEAALGEILERNHVRDKVYIATKLPHYMIRSREGLDKTFNEELRRLRTDHVDYYLMHMLTNVDTWNKLKTLGIVEWLEQKKAEGAIRQVGFSYHGNSDSFIELLDAYDWDFCQIQYNYMDETSQAGIRGLKAAHERGLPVIIMEPLRGGKLANNLPAEAMELFENYNKEHAAADHGTAPVEVSGTASGGESGIASVRTTAEWAFRWLWNQPEVTCVLSGMNSLEMVQENCASAASANAGDLDEADLKLLADVAASINARMLVACTGCRYCMPCPKGVDIPGTFAAYNRTASEGTIAGIKDYFMCTALRKDSSAASLCIECGKCEQHCPQGIHIREELKNARRKLEGPAYKIARWAVKTARMY